MLSVVSIWHYIKDGLSSQVTFTWPLPLLSPVECDPAKQFMCADQTKCVPIRHRCEVTPTTDCLDGSDEKNCNTTGRPVMSAVCVTAVIVESG